MPGTTFTGPLTVEAAPGVTAFAALSALTDNTTGTAGATVADVGGAFNQATLNNNFATLTAQINALIERIG